MPSGGATSGSTIAVGQDHVAIEVDDFTNRVHQALVRRFGNRHLNTIADVERDITAIMSQYVLDQSIDMCKEEFVHTLRASAHWFIEG